MSDCDGSLKNSSFQHRPLLKKVKFGYSWCSKCPPRSRTHDHRRGRHCFMARSLITWSRSCHSSTTARFSLHCARSSIFFNNLITDDRHQPLFEKSFRNFFAPLPCSCLSTLIKMLSSSVNSIFYCLQ